MRARVISYNLATLQATEDIINEWLDEVGDIRIDRCVTLGNAGPDRDSGGLVIFYHEEGAVSRPSKSSKLCRQCKKRPPLDGMKSCAECRDYQKRYREQRKAERKKSRYP